METSGIAHKKGVMDTIKSWVAHNRQVWLALYVPAYLIVFCLLQARQVPVRTVHFAFDYRIPFCEYFIIPYCAWYFLLIGVGLYTLLKDKTSFIKYMLFMIIGYTACMLVYWVYPIAQDLRPPVFPRDNFCSRLVGLIYSMDPPFNILPSMHVVGSFMCAAAVANCPTVKRTGSKVLVSLLAVVISISTVFVKQHSVLDTAAAFALSIIIFFILYAPWGKAKRERISPPAQRNWLIGGIAGFAVSVLCIKFTLENLPL